MQSPLLAHYPATWTVNSIENIGHIGIMRFDEVRIVPLTHERLAVHNLVYGRSCWIIRSSATPSSVRTVGITDSASIETVATEDATRGWIRAELRGCHCGCCEPHWFQYGWECWE